MDGRPCIAVDQSSAACRQNWLSILVLRCGLK